MQPDLHVRFLVRQHVLVEEKFERQGALEAPDHDLRSLGASGSTTEISQVANEATVQFLYLQSRQNAEIIQLLTDIKNKK
ncbi:hypothetical protein [Deinococcus sp. 6GRE01]|uniref:hypothetical protein n=1 Tax=Deinococcus sp. 6GRE01 TaxID=2745873 RepID=UPI001E388FE0|nr:hypothetical protein [Deinococcus sp. 6GRE01]MCD0158651.1 hypothetical protein [Deinococcus sp. 6GRE01]